MRILLTICLVVLLTSVSAQAVIEGSSTASNCGEGGNWIDITFTTTEGVSLVDAWWDFNGTSVWLDADGISMCEMINDGVSSFSFYFDGVAGDDTQDFGLTATGFDSGDYFRFVMDLDLGTTGMPYGADYMGGTLTVEFSDATILTTVFDTPYDETNGATASFSNLPNLEFTIKPGWEDAFVPRSENDASWTSVPAPTFLIGESDSTWFNAVYQNTGGTQAGSTRMLFHADGQSIGYRNLWIIQPGDWNGPVNAGPYNIRGGRHVLRVTADALNAVAESDETDNVYAVQYCWQGDYLAPLASETRAAPPKTDQDFEYSLSGWWNCDGLRITPSPSYNWSSVWCERDSDDGNYNYMLRLHPTSEDPEDAFGANVVASRIYDNLHALLINTHTVGSDPWDIGVLNFNGSSVDYRVSHLHESPYPFDFGIDPETPYTATRLMMFEFHVDPGDLGAATLTAYSDPEDGPVRMGWLAPDFTYGCLEDLQDEVVTDDQGNAKIDLNLAATGDYCVVVYGNRSEHPGNLSVNVGLYGPMPDLMPITMTGWYAPTVPRPAADALLFSCPLPDTLYGNQPLTWMNCAGKNDGPDDASVISFGVGLDGTLKLGLRNAVTWGAGDTKNYRNLEFSGEPWTVRGGRHTLFSRLDYLSEVNESIERNNESGRQYCWSPLVLPTNGSLTFADSGALPDRTGAWDTCDDPGQLYWNCDGLRMPYIPPVGGNRWWYGTAVMPWFETLDIDLELHNPLTGTQDGFGPAPLANSTWGDGQIDFVLVNDRYADNHDYDVGVLDDVDSYCPGYYAQEARSTWGGIPENGELGPYTMGTGRMLDLHEYMLDPGLWLITLKDNNTSVDWGMSLYQAGTYHGKGDVVENAISYYEGDGVTERMLVDVPAASSFCLAVWKTSAGELAKDGNYSLWLAPGVSSVDDTPVILPLATRLVSASPNPFNPRTKITFELTRRGFCHLAMYDVQGRLVRTLLDEERPAGTNLADWDGLDNRGLKAASGTYLVKLQTSDKTDLLKVTLVK